MSKKDTSVTESVWLCAALVYLGYELCSLSDIDFQTTQFRVQCAALDFEEIKQEYEENRLALSSAKDFVDAFNRIVQIQKSYRRRGESDWSSPDYIAGRIG
jgi:hypothetical protein